MPGVVERLAIIVESNAGKAIAEFRQLGAASKSLSGEAANAQGALAGIGGRIGGLVGSAGPAALAAGAVAAGLAIAKFADDSISAFMNLAGEVRRFRAVAGGTAEDSSRLVAVFHALNLDVDSAATFFGRFAKTLGASGDGLAKVGIAAVRTSAGNLDISKTFLNVVDAWNRTSDAGERATIGAAAFGRGWVALAPILAKGRQGVEELYAEAERHHLILDDQDLVRAAQLKVALRDLSESVKGIQVEAGRSLVPIATAAVNLIDKALARVDQAVHGSKSATGLWGFVTTATHDVLAGLGEVVSFLPGVDSALATTGATAAVTETDLTSLGDALATMVNSDRALASSKRSLAADQRALAADTRSYNDLLKQGAVDTQKVADATRSLADANRSVGHAHREQTKAQEEYNKAAAAADILGTDTAQQAKQDAADNLADANDNVASAIERQTAAAAELAKAKAGDPDYQTKLAAAKQKVADDTQAIADAEYNVGQQSLANVAAHNAEATAIAGKAAAAERLLADYVLLIAQHPEVAAVLGPQIPALAAAESAPDTGNILGGLTTPKPPPPPGTPTGGGTSTIGKVANVVVNITQAVTDPASIARNIVWHLGL